MGLLDGMLKQALGGGQGAGSLGGLMDLVVKNPQIVSLICVVSLAAGCATAFSPAMIRGEIAKQTGQDPRGVLEVSLGRTTMALTKAVLGAAAAPGTTLPLTGVTAFEMASYDFPAGSAGIDFSSMPIRGWEPILKFREGTRSALVLVQTDGKTIGDLVLVAGDAGRVLYARIQGSLSPDLPAALGRTVRIGGPDAAQKELLIIVK